ncbi:MAG: hypothetical protein KF858_10590 [Candidatus Sumerlaeia bacterium]|nr:hypothetical protein [Candidatus Sumerlaeia bacterium]
MDTADDNERTQVLGTRPAAQHQWLAQFPSRVRTGPHKWDELVAMAAQGRLMADCILINDTTGERHPLTDFPQLINSIPEGDTDPIVTDLLGRPSRLALGLGVGSLVGLLLCILPAIPLAAAALLLAVKGLPSASAMGDEKARTRYLVAVSTATVALGVGALALVGLLAFKLLALGPFGSA